MKSVKLLFALFLFLGLFCQRGQKFRLIQNSEIQDAFVLPSEQAFPCVLPEHKRNLEQEASSLTARNFIALPFKANSPKGKKDSEFARLLPLELSEKKLSRYIKSVIAIQSLP